MLYSWNTCSRFSVCLWTLMCAMMACCPMTRWLTNGPRVSFSQKKKRSFLSARNPTDHDLFIIYVIRVHVIVRLWIAMVVSTAFSSRTSSLGVSLHQWHYRSQQPVAIRNVISIGCKWDIVDFDEYVDKSLMTIFALHNWPLITNFHMHCELWPNRLMSEFEIGRRDKENKKGKTS